MRRRPASDFQLLAPLIVTRDPALVRPALIRLQAGELTLSEARDLLAAIEPHPVLLQLTEPSPNEG